MELNETIDKYLTRDFIVEMLTKYELYYHISLGNFVMETIQDFDSTVKKLQEMNLQVEVNIALATIIELMVFLQNKPNFEDSLELEIRKRATLKSLKDFINKDEELLNSDDYISMKSEVVVEDKFFTDSMKIQFESDYPTVHEYYDMLITDDAIERIKKTLE